MTDQAEKVVLEAEDLVTPAVNRANAALDSHEKKAESSNTRIIRINDGTRSSVQRLISSMEKLEQTYGKSGVDRIIAQRDQLLSRWNKEPAAVDAITRAYGKMIEEERKVQSEAKFEGIGDKIKEFIENPLQSVKSLFMGMGGWIAVGVASLTAFAAAGFEAMKWLGEYGDHIHDVGVRTGLAAKEVVQFEFAAQAAGSDVSVFERAMRGLSQAADDTTSQGAEARKWLKEMGVSLREARTGELKPTAEVLETLSEELAKLPNVYERNIAGMAIFKRQWIDMAPAMLELGENLKIAREKGWGPSDEEVKRLQEYKTEVTEIETAWRELRRQFLEPFVVSFIFVAKVAGGAAAAGTAPGAFFRLLFGGKVNPEEVGLKVEVDPMKAASIKATERDLGMMRTSGDEVMVGMNDRLVAQARAAAREAVGGGHTALSNAESELSDAVNKLQTGVYPNVTAKARADVETAARTVESLKAQAELEKEHATWLKTSQQYQQQGAEAELDAIGKIYLKRDELLQQAKKVKASEQEIAAVRGAADAQANVLIRKAWQEFGEFEATEGPKRAGQAAAGMLPGAAQMKEWGEGFAANGQIAGIEMESQRNQIRLRSRGQLAMATAGGAEGLDAIGLAYRNRLDLANELARVEAERIADPALSAAEKLVATAKARKDVELEIAAAQEEALEKQAELMHRQEEQIGGKAGGLFRTLLDRPREFGRQLAGTMRDAVLSPITKGAGDMVSQILQPAIFGANGGGGIAGMFRGAFGGRPQDPVKISTDLNTQATMQNTAAVASLSAVFAGGGMPAVASTFGSSATWGLGGSGADVMNLPMSHALNPLGLAGIGPGGTSGFAGPLGGIFGGGSGGGRGIFGGMSGWLSNLKGSVFNSGSIQLGGGAATTAAGIGGLGGTLAGVLTSPAAAAGMLMGGSVLAQSGLLGSYRGTWGGVAMGAGGGALVGAGIGTMIAPGIGTLIGAGIGAAAGFGIGIGEKIFGVKSDEQSAHEDVKSVYGIDIPTNSATIRQIVQMAKEQFGGSISIAVRSPSVRQLVMLYSEATGQKMPFSAATPYGGSLVEQGGSLYQEATWKNNQMGAYGSSLPTLGGFSPVTYPSAAPTYLSLNISGAAVAPFMTGQYVTPQFVADQAMSAQGTGYGRTQQAANLQAPGLTVG